VPLYEVFQKLADAVGILCFH